jgi:hypothetical protein
VSIALFSVAPFELKLVDGLVGIMEGTAALEVLELASGIVAPIPELAGATVSVA